MATNKTRATTTTAEERQAQAQALHDSITAQVEMLRDSGQWARFLTFATAFHAYSLNNLLLILAQCPNASHVAGFRKWQTLGQQVRKGEKGIRIFGYSTKKITEEAADGEQTERRVVRFPILTVFDLSQTDPIDPAAGPVTLTAQLTGADDFGVTAALETHLTSEGWTVAHRLIPGAANGYASRDTMMVVLDAGLSPEQRARRH